jgi:hypothetical protein
LRKFLRWCTEQDPPLLAAVPPVDLPRPKNDRHAKRRRVGDLTPELLTFLFAHAALHLKAQIYVQWCTGARVRSVLFGCRLCDLVLSPERSTILFRDTKNGDDVPAALHPVAALVVADYLAERGQLTDREGPLFLTPSGRPYSRHSRDNGEGGSENKTAWRAMVRRAVAARRAMAETARAQGQLDATLALHAEADLLAEVTPHWLRHWLVTHGSASGMTDGDIMAQGGWRDRRSIGRYQHDVSDQRRRAVEGLPLTAPEGAFAGSASHNLRTEPFGPTKKRKKTSA